MMAGVVTKDGVRGLIARWGSNAFTIMRWRGRLVFVCPHLAASSASVFGLTCPPGGQVSGNTVLLSFCVSFSAPFKQLLLFFFAELSLYEHFS